MNRRPSNGCNAKVRSKAECLGRLVVITVVLTLAVACNTIETQSQLHEGGVPDSLTTFTWAATEDPSLEEPLDLDIRAAIEREFEKLGLQRFDDEGASLGVAYATSIESEVRYNDPYFDRFIAEEYEVGTLTIELIESETGRPFWQGSGSSELRVSAVPAGPFATELTPRDVPRRWRIDDKVAAIFDEFVADMKSARVQLGP